MQGHPARLSCPCNAVTLFRLAQKVNILVLLVQLERFLKPLLPGLVVVFVQNLFVAQLTKGA